MLKYILFFTLSLFFVSCSNDNSSLSDANTLSITRAPAASGVDITHELAIGFSSSLDFTSISSVALPVGTLVEYPIDTTTPIYLSDSSGTLVNANLILDDMNTSRVLIRPNLYLTPSTTYSITVTTDITDIDGNTLSEDASISFTTSSVTANPNTQLSFVDMNPPDTTTTDVTPTISIGFDREIAPSSLPMFSVVDDGSNVVTGTFTYFNSKITFTPDTPLLDGVPYIVTMTNTPTDMYGNAYNEGSGMSWFFNVGNTLTAGAYTIITTYPTASDAYMLEAFKDVGGTVDIVAVAVTGGIDIYQYLAPNFIKKANISISSPITDMLHVDTIQNTSSLVVATKSEGIFIIDVSSDFLTINKYNYLSTTGGVTGVGYSSDINGFLDRVYAVGPDVGLKIFDALNGISNLVEMTSVAIPDGKPLKVFGYNDGLGSRYTYVSDYEQGLRVYDENGTTPSLIAGIGDMKFLNFVDNLGDVVTIMNSVGNMYSTSATSPATLNLMYSFIGDVVAEAKISFGIYALGVKGGLYVYEPYLVGAKFLPITGGIVSVSVVNGTDIVGLDSLGNLHIINTGV